MKKLKFMALLLGLVFVTSNAFAIPEPTTAIWKNKSQESGNSAPCRILKLVRNSAAGPNEASIVSRDAVVYDTVSDDGITVTLTTTSGDNSFAGIAVTNIQSSDAGVNSFQNDTYHRNWGWIIVHGPAIAKVTAGGTNGNAAGDFFVTSADSGAIAGPQVAGVPVAGGGTANAYTIATRLAAAKGGFFYSAADSTSTAVTVQVENE